MSIHKVNNTSTTRPMRLSRVLAFPNPVNEVSARLVAAGVVVLAGVALALQQRWLLVPLAYGFLARVATGPTLSPLGQLVTRVVTPRLPFAPRPVPGPPKRFAQAIGALFSSTALALAFTGHAVLASAVLGALIVAASLEAFAGICLGCRVFSMLMRAGVIPAGVCQECLDIAGRLSARSVEGSA
ncbi:MAG TPA: DUF4395 domain-containing protein [Candidatus Dormibacteraeota bacterium]|nr:DUF4395 domain-containing protein [Candidatus Dormibacteraeota bacterium]